MNKDSIASVYLLLLCLVASKNLKSNPETVQGLKVGEIYNLFNARNNRQLLDPNDPVERAESYSIAQNKKLKNAVANIEYRAFYIIEKAGEDRVRLKNRKTGRYVLATGEIPTAKEGGWNRAPYVVGADKDYDNRSVWIVKNEGVYNWETNYYSFRNAYNNRWLLGGGAPTISNYDEPMEQGADVKASDLKYYVNWKWKAQPTGMVAY